MGNQVIKEAKPKYSYGGIREKVTPTHEFKIQERQHLIDQIDLRSKCPPVYNQYELNSCTGNALAGAFEFDLMAQKLNNFTPSRLFIWYNERTKEGTINQNVGALISDGVESLLNQGVCPESEWPYDVSEFAVKPTDGCYSDALKHKLDNYKSFDRNLNQMKQSLINGYPFVFAFSVYESFESSEVAKTGIMPIPQPDEKFIFDHVVMAVGFDDSKQWFIVRNSWGTDWGDQGYFYMPYEFMMDEKYTDGYWILNHVE